MTSPDSRPDVPLPPEHRAPPRDERTRSSLGTWALVLSLVFVVLSLFLGFLWLACVPAVVFAAWAMFKIDPARQKGHGLALMGLLLAVLGGLGAYGCSAAMNAQALKLGRGVLAAASSQNEPQRLDGWLTEKALEDGLADVIRERYQAVVELVGPYEKEIEEGSALAGGTQHFLPPSGVVEVGQKIGEAMETDNQALWFRARFRDEVIHVRIQWAHDDMETLQRMATNDASAAHAVVKDVRFFRDKTAPKPATTD